MKVAILGAGSFGTAMARVISLSPNVSNVSIWARRQEIVNEINDKRTNTKYIPLEKNQILFKSDKVKAYDCLQSTLRGAKIVLLCIPSQFLDDILNQIKIKVNIGQDLIFISLIKSIHIQNGKLGTVCYVVQKQFPKNKVMCMMGPNIYKEMIYEGSFAEATIGYLPSDEDSAEEIRDLINNNEFQLDIVNDRLGVELCGSLKNVIALFSGFCDDLNLGANTRAVVIRKGLKEMSLFPLILGDLIKDDCSTNIKKSTFFEQACGIGDLILTLTAGRGRLLAARFSKERREKGICGSPEKASERWAQLEDDLFHGMKLPDWHNAKVIYELLVSQQVLDQFKIFKAVYDIGYMDKDPATAIRETLISSSTCLVTSKDKIIQNVEDTLLQKGKNDQKYQYNFYGKRVLVTGAAQGIGRGIAEQLAAWGATVVGVDMDSKKIEDFENKNTGIKGIVLDLLDFATVEKVFHYEIEENGPFDFLVNCAGIAKFEKFFDTDFINDNAYEMQYGVNVKSAMFLTQLITKAMVDSNIKHGSVVHISSQSSTLALTDHLIYSSSKAAIDHVARIQALELGKYNIRVNTVRPTLVLTDLAKANWKPDALEVMKSQIPLQKVANVTDVALAVGFLLSDQASMITGENLAVDGGRSMGGFGL